MFLQDVRAEGALSHVGVQRYRNKVDRKRGHWAGHGYLPWPAFDHGAPAESLTPPVSLNSLRSVLQERYS